MRGRAKREATIRRRSVSLRTRARVKFSPFSTLGMHLHLHLYKTIALVTSKTLRQRFRDRRKTNGERLQRSVARSLLSRVHSHSGYLATPINPQSRGQRIQTRAFQLVTCSLARSIAATIARLISSSNLDARCVRFS